MAESRRTEIAPPELATLVDLSERPRADNWSLHAALTRYAQPQPMKVSRLLDVVRRIEGALSAETAVLRRNGPDLWAALDDEAPGIADRASSGADGHARLVGVLRCARCVDVLGDALAAWAVNREGDRPDDAVDAVTADVAARLDELGVAREERLPPAARRRG